MLSRIAESMYWVGRYVERAEDTARIVDVHVHHILEDPSVEEAAACKTLIDALGAPSPPGELDIPAVTRVLAFDDSDASSIVGSLTAARENGRGSREILSSEVWECLNATYHALGVQVARVASQGPHAFFRWVKERTAMVSGLVDSTMSRDDAWRFLVLGRSLERVDMTARLLWGCFSQHGGSMEWVTTLRSCSAQEAFVKTYKRPAEASLVAEFLLLDRLFPRSALHSLTLAERCLSDLDPRADRTGLMDDARRILGRARNDLEFARVGELLSDLPSHLRALQTACADAGKGVSSRFFRQGAAVEWNLEGAAQS